MDPDLVVIFGSLTATAVALGGLGLFGFRMWLKHQSSALESLPDDVRRHIDDAVRDQVTAALQERDRDVEDLHERLDFAERLLAQSRRLPDASEHPTPG